MKKNKSLPLDSISIGRKKTIVKIIGNIFNVDIKLKWSQKGNLFFIFDFWIVRELFRSMISSLSTH